MEVTLYNVSRDLPKLIRLVHACSYFNDSFSGRDTNGY